MKFNSYTLKELVKIKYGKNQKDIAFLLEEERIAVTDTILAEILPIFIRDKRSEIIEVMRSFEKYTTFINWEGIIASQEWEGKNLDYLQTEKNVKNISSQLSQMPLGSSNPGLPVSVPPKPQAVN